MPLVESLQQVEERVAQFVQTAPELTQLNSYKNWYYFRNQAAFAPAKFIGYVDGTDTEQEERHGAKAKDVLSELGFRRINPDEHSIAYRRWRDALEEFINAIGGRVNQGVDQERGGIFLLDDEFDELTRERKQQVWLVRALGNWASSFIEHGYVGFGYGFDGVDLSLDENRRELRSKYRDLNPRDGDGRANQIIPQIYRFISEIETGDYVLTVSQTQQGSIHCGTVGGFEYTTDGNPCPNRRPVSWIGASIDGSALKEFPPKTVYELADDQRDLIFSQIGRIDLRIDRPQARTDSPSNSGTDVTPLSKDLLLPRDFLHDVLTSLEEKRQVIFQGPPGTGKTYVAQRLAEWLAGSSTRVDLVQFHPSYTYEDFVQGFRPRLSKKGRNAGFALHDGPLLLAAKKAAAKPDARHFLIIDEINRGRLASVFGELYFLLEYRGERMRLQYSPKQSFQLPENLYIIGTMNTADRSIALIDLALRRRFYFIEFDPTERPIDGLLYRWLTLNAPAMEWVAKVVSEANRRLDSPHVAIGPSYFMRNGLDEDMVKRIWNHSVMPYIKEHIFGEPDRMQRFELDALRMQSRDDASEGELGTDVSEDDEQGL